MKLISMKRDIKPEVEKTAAVGECASLPRDEYDYGLRLTLNAESLKKLGITDAVDDYDIDDEIVIIAKCLVKRVEKSKAKDDYGKEKERENESLELQITDMAFDQDDGKSDDDIDWDSSKKETDDKLKKRGF
jgi:hypothetical protein